MSTNPAKSATLTADWKVAESIIASIGADNINSVQVTGNSQTREVSLHFTDPSRGAEFAGLLGLTVVTDYGAFRTWAGAIAGVPVVVYGDAEVTS